MIENVICIITVALAVLFFVGVTIVKSKIGWSWINNKKEEE